MKKKNYCLIESKMFGTFEDIDRFKMNDIQRKVSLLNRTFVFQKQNELLPLAQLGKVPSQRSSFLTENEKIQKIQELKDTLNEKINNVDSLKKINEYQFIRDNFENAYDVINQQELPGNIKKMLIDNYNKI